MQTFNSVLLMSPGQDGVANLLFLAMIIVVFFFFIIRPQLKRQKEMKNFREGLKKGDKVITVGGIYGKITDVKDDSVTLEIASNVLVKVDKNGLVRDSEDLREEHSNKNKTA